MGESMPRQGAIHAARAVAGFLLLAHIVGMLFYGPRLSSLWIGYGALVVSTLSVFCLLPRRWLRPVRVLIVALAGAALCATIVMAYQDITMINGTDYGALVFRGLLMGILVIMIVEAVSRPKEGQRC